MKARLALLVVVSVGFVTHAAPVDEAVAAVTDAQHAADEGGCKGLGTKLRLALEALERVRKSSAKGVADQAKGRLQTALDAAGAACPEPGKAKVTQALGVALAALNRPVAAAPKTGAAFNAPCRSNDECASDHCHVGATADGRCTKVCAAAHDCPEGWQCRQLGGVPEKVCTP